MPDLAIGRAAKGVMMQYPPDDTMIEAYHRDIAEQLPHLRHHHLYRAEVIRQRRCRKAVTVELLPGGCTLYRLTPAPAPEPAKPRRRRSVRIEMIAVDPQQLPTPRRRSRKPAVSPEEHLAMAERLATCPKLSPWEAGFVPSIREQLAHGQQLTARQAACLRRIYDEMIGSAE
jgi:hypothetical protein